MNYLHVTVLLLGDNSCFVCVPLGNNEMKQFCRKLINLVQKADLSPPLSKHKSKMGIRLFEISTDLTEKDIERLANQALKEIISEKRGVKVKNVS